MLSQEPQSRKANTHNSALVEVDVAMLELAMPSQASQRVGVLVLDVKRDQLFCKVNQVPNIDEDASEVLAYLVDDLEIQARERGGKVVLGYLQDTLSNVLRISDSKRIYVADPREAIDLLGEMSSDDVARPDVALAPSSSTVALSQVLIVEDNSADVFMIQEGFRMCSLNTQFTVATDGEIAIRLLDSIGADVPTPDLILLDINLPKRDGFEVLKSFRASPKLSKTPISMLTSSFRGADFEKALRNGANCYALKGNDLDSLSHTIQALTTFCLTPGPPSGVAFIHHAG